MEFTPASRPLLRMLDLRNTRLDVFPEPEEFLVMFYGFDLPAFLLVERDSFL